MRIERDPIGKGYRIYIGDGKRGGHKAKNSTEVAEAVRHYWENKDLGNNEDCPLCRSINEEMAQMRKST